MLRHGSPSVLMVLAATLVAACGGDVTTPPAVSDISLMTASPCITPRIGASPGGRSHPSLGLRDSVPLTGTPFAVAISPSGVLYVTQTSAASMARGQLPGTTFPTSFPVGPLPSQVRMSPDGKTAYVANQDARTIGFISVSDNRTFATLAVPNGSILTLGLSPDGRRLYALTDFFGVYVINTVTRRITETIPASAVGSILTGVAFHPFSPCLYLAARDEGVVSTLDTRNHNVVRSVAVAGGRIQNVAVSRDGAQLFATDIERSKLIRWDLRSGGTTFDEVAIGSPVRRNAFDVAVTPDNAQVYVSTLADGKVFIFDLATGALVDAVATGGSARYIAFDAAGAAAVIPNEFGWVNFIGVGSPPPPPPPPPPPSVCSQPTVAPPPGGRSHPTLTVNEAVPHDGIPFGVAVSRDSIVYVTLAAAGTAVRTDLPTTTFSGPFAVGPLPSQVRISSDGQMAYVSNQDVRTVTVVRVGPDTVITSVPVPYGSILTLGVSPDGSRVYALTDFFGVWIIDTNTRSVVGHIEAADAGFLLTGIAFHPHSPCMYLAARDEGIVRTVDLGTNMVVCADTVPGGRTQNVAVSLDGGFLYATDIERSMLITWDLTNHAAARIDTPVGTPTSRNAFDVAVTPDNAQLYVSTLADGQVFVFDRVTHAPLGAIATGGSARYIGFSPGGSHAVISNESGWVSFVR